MNHLVQTICRASVGLIHLFFNSYFEEVRRLLWDSTGKVRGVPKHSGTTVDYSPLRSLTLPSPCQSARPMRWESDTKLDYQPSSHSIFRATCIQSRLIHFILCVKHILDSNKNTHICHSTKDTLKEILSG